MARPREFDEEQVVDAAMNVFWEHGYDNTSITMLEKGTGLTTGSLYKAFKGKKTLFLAAMSRYEAEQVAPAIALLQSGTSDTPVQRIERLFRLIPEAVRKGDRRGCLLCSAAAGPSFDDSEISELVELLIGQFRSAFQQVFEGIMSPQDSRARARVLVTHYVGLRILARAQLSPEELDQSVEALLLMFQRELGT